MDRVHDRPIMDTISRGLHGFLHVITIMPHAHANPGLAQPSRLPWIRKCAELASIRDEILAMPMGFHTHIGDMGSALSAGQRQRVMLARALYRRPRILLLDEATSNLDLDNERSVNLAIQALNITRVVIAHRPETIASADRVIDLACAKVEA